MTDEPLKFKVAPHIVEDLGLNLYTDLPRVLVEFVANAYDADSPDVSIEFDHEAIKKARNVARADYKAEVARAEGGHSDVDPLGERVLPSDLDIVIRDSGHGMSREDLDTKFLVAGRRRRDEADGTQGTTPGGRVLMGRKGLGKLAAFGVAKRMEVLTRKSGDSYATKIVLDYDELTKESSTHQIEIRDERLEDGGGLGDGGGTLVRLSELLFDPMKSRSSTIEQAISEHFMYVDPADFQIMLNGTAIPPHIRDHAYAWPEPDRDRDELVGGEVETDDGEIIRFQYRIRFTEDRNALPGSRRGVRVYAHKRLACAPSLLDADTNMHGFRMTDYMDGVVCADFLDERKVDYISTDRQDLRWDSLLLAPLRRFLSEQIKEACSAYQEYRDERAPDVIRDDGFTQEEIAKREFSSREQKMANRIAAVLKSACKQGVADPDYKKKLPILLHGIGHGSILTAMSSLAEQTSPSLDRVAVQVAKLSADEYDQFIAYAKTRLKGIDALRKIVKAADFKTAQNEGVIQKLFEKSPWLIDPAYTQFLSADRGFNETFTRLAKYLGIGRQADPKSVNQDERPDLVFMLGSSTLDRIIVVELKSSNLPLESKHLDQLVSYMRDIRKWLKEHDVMSRVQGHLIGTFGDHNSNARGQKALQDRIEEAGPNSQWSVRDYTQVLDNAKLTHQELIAISEKMSQRENSD